jgi:uncharacterized membrane protein
MTGLPIVPLVALGLLFFATPIIVLVLILVLLSLRSRVRRLEARLGDLEQRSGAPHAGAVPTATGAVEPVEPLPSSPSVPDRQETLPGLEAGPALMTRRSRLREPAGTSGWVRGGGRGATRSADRAGARAVAGVGPWEGRLGGAWLSRVGAVLFFLGVGFFLKHAFEQEWIGAKGRVLAGLVAGVAMTAGGMRLAGGATYRLPAQSLVAVGIGVIYLSLYAAHAFYALVGAPVAFVAMALATAVGFATALRLDSRALAVLATLGGLLTPIILNTDTDAAAALFTYLAILDLGVLLLASWRRWPGLALLAFAGTQVLYWGWLDRWYQAPRLPVALGWASVFFLAFAAWALRGPGTDRSAGTVRLGRTLIILGAPALYFAAARRILDDPSGRRLALLALALAGTYLVAARVAARSARGGPRVALLHRALALAFLALAPAVTLGRHDLAIAWSVEGLVLLLGGFALNAPGLRAGGLAISALAWGRWFEALGENAGRAGTFLLAHPALPATLAVVVTAIVGALVYRARERGGATLGGWERFARPLLLLVAVGSAALLLTVELGQFRTLAIPPPYVPVVKSVVWMLATMILLALARGDETRVLLGVATLLLLALVGEALGGTDRWARIQPSLRPAIGNPRFLAGCLLVVLTWLYGQVAEAAAVPRGASAPPACGGGLRCCGPPAPLEPERRGRAGAVARDPPGPREAPQRGPLRAVGGVRVHGDGLGTLAGLRTPQGGRNPALQRDRAEGARRGPGGPRRALPHPVGSGPRRGPADRVLPLRPIPPALGRDGLTRPTTARWRGCPAGQSPPATSRRRSFRIARAALCPGAPVTSPPGWVPAPHR